MSPGNWVKKQSKYTILYIALALFLFDEYLDYITGPELNLAYFHLVPIFLIVWNSGFLAGAAYSFFCTIVIAVIEWMTSYPSGHGFSSNEFLNGCANLVFFLIFSFVLDRLNKNLDKVTYMAERDGLTGLLNFQTFFQKAGQEMKANAQKGLPFTVVYFDMDNFKQINDTLGHAEGDEVLVLVGNTLKTNLRKNDLSARIGGDEFVLMLPDLSMAQAEARIPEIFEKLNHVMRESNRDVTFSAGAVTYVRAPQSIKDAIRDADGLMYKAKKKGKNNFILKLSTDIKD